jgi:hypothetical protein
LIYTYGFPDQAAAITEVEREIVQEAEARARRSIDKYSLSTGDPT